MIWETVNPIYCNAVEYSLQQPGEYTGFGGYEAQIFEEALRPGMTVVDVGANVGFLSLIAKKIVGEEGIVFAFEPNELTFQLLVANMNLKHLSLHPQPFALGDRVGDQELYISDIGDAGDHRTYRPRPLTELRASSFESQFVLRSDDPRSRTQHQRQAQKIWMETLDGYLTDNNASNLLLGKGLFHVDLIKLDVQGFEPQVLKGAQRTIEMNPHLKLFTEFDPKLLNDAGNDPYEFLRALSQNFYLLDINTNGGNHLAPLLPAQFESFMADLMHPTLGRFANLLCEKK